MDRIGIRKRTAYRRKKAGGHRCQTLFVCTAIDTMGKEFAEMPESERPENVLCVIITDGQENASKEFSTDDVKKRILS